MHIPSSLCPYSLSKVFSSAEVLSMSSFVTNLQQLIGFWMYRSWNARHVCESTTNCPASRVPFSAWHLKAQVILPISTQRYLHLAPQRYLLPSSCWGMSLSRVRYDNYAEIISLYSLGSLSSWDQILHSYAFIISHICLGSGTVKVAMQQHWRGMDKDGNTPWQQSKYWKKWNKKPK